MNISIILFTIVISMITMIYSIVKLKKPLNYVSIIIGWYSIFLIMSELPLFDFIITNNGAREFVITNVVVICLITALFSKYRTSNGRESSSEELEFNNDESTLHKVHRYMTWCSTIIDFFLLGSVILGFARGRITFFTWRTLAFDATGNGLFSGFTYQLYFTYLKGFVIFDVIYHIAHFVMGKEKFSFHPYINLVLYSIIIASRIEILRLLIIVFASIVIVPYRSMNNLTIETKRKLFKTIIFAGFIAVGIRFFSSVNNTSGILSTTMRALFGDMTLPYVLFDKFFSSYKEGERLLVNPNLINILFGGILQLLERLTSIFGIHFENMNAELGVFLNRGVNITYDTSKFSNAFYTMYFNFINGGGIVGSYIVSFFFGIVLSAINNRMVKTKSMKSVCSLVFFVQIIIMGLLRWEFASFWPWVTLLFLLLFGNDADPINRKIYLKAGNSLL